MVLNTVAEKAQISKFNGNPGFLMVTCCANSRFICFLINQKECSFYFSHLVESMLFSFLLLQIGATQEKGCFNFCFWLVFQGWVSIVHVKTYCNQLQSSFLKDCKNLTKIVLPEKTGWWYWWLIAFITCFIPHNQLFRQKQNFPSELQDYSRIPNLLLFHREHSTSLLHFFFGLMSKAYCLSNNLSLSVPLAY